jgi:hypothetical protein
MNNPSLNIFLVNYINSLGERTRKDKKTINIGFDWIIYNLALAKSWTPVRLPFFRQVNVQAAKTKTEAEFGIDMSFLTHQKDELLIFVLKDEILNNKNWNKSNFDSDLRMAASPDLSSKELSKVKSIKVILAYNKDEDQTGIKLFNNLTSSFDKKISKKRTRDFERWNLTKITDEVKTHLISPDLLPQHVSSQFNYICSQVADFDYGSEEWENQLVPNWKSFIRIALQGPVDERKLRLISVALLILYHYKKESPNSYPGWIDLIEWAMLSLWECHKNLKTKKLKKIVVDIWLLLYINELEKYFLEVSNAFTTEHGIHCNQSNIGLVPVNDAYIAYWHIGRLGILTIAPHDFIGKKNKEGKKLILDLLDRSVDLISKCLRLNPSSMRPLIDLHHIELFLIWLIYWQSGRNDEIYKWLSALESRLLVRRIGNANIPFIEGNNRMDLVAEYAATSDRPPEYNDDSSYLLLMILELCFSLENKERDELLDRYYQRIVKGIGDDGEVVSEKVKDLDLIGWIPPDNWGQRILHESVTDGIAITTHNFDTSLKEANALSKKIKDFVDQSREKFPSIIPLDIPHAVLILACIKHKSPLPSEFWRGSIFQNEKNEE